MVDAVGTDGPTADVRALPGAVEAFAAALAAGVPTRTSAQPNFPHTMRFGPSISKGNVFQVSWVTAKMTCFWVLR